MAAITDTATGQDSANVLIYCDEDKRWQHATSAQVAGNDDRPSNRKAWFDDENKIVYDPPNSADNTPGCRSSDPVQGQTYCNCLTSNDKCTITLCERAVTTNFLALSDFGNRNLASNPQLAKIDYFALLSTTILHEVGCWPR